MLFKKRVDELPFDPVGMHHVLEAVQYGVNADPLADGVVRLLTDAHHHYLLVVAVKTVHDLVG